MANEPRQYQVDVDRRCWDIWREIYAGAREQLGVPFRKPLANETTREYVNAMNRVAERHRYIKSDAAKKLRKAARNGN